MNSTNPTFPIFDPKFSNQYQKVPSDPVQIMNQTIWSDKSSNTIYQMSDKIMKKHIDEVESAIRISAETNACVATDCLDSPELLQGLLFQNEKEIGIPPLLIASLRCEDWKVSQYIFNAFAILTSTRLLLMKVSKSKCSTLAKEKPRHLINVEEITVGHTITDGNFFYPIPLKNIHGISFRSSYESSTFQVLQKKRYEALFILLILLFIVAISLIVNYAQNTNYLEIIIIAFSSLIFIVSLVFCLLFKYPTNPISCSFYQNKCIEIGFIDPLSQKNAIAYLELQNNYSLRSAKDFISAMQNLTPHLSGV